MRAEPLTAAQSPLSHETMLLTPAVVSVVDGAPVPWVETVAGVAASCAPDHLSTTMEWGPELPEQVTVTVMDAEAVTGAVQM